MSKPPSSVLTPSAPPPAPVVPRPRLDETRVLDCEVFHYPWDDWERWALAQGLDPAVAAQARLLIREAFQHDWPEELRGLCGWRDDGQALFELARRAPKRALRQWEILMRTDGLRGDYPPSRRSGAFSRARMTNWIWGWLRADARRLLLQLTTQNPQPTTHPHGPHR